MSPLVVFVTSGILIALLPIAKSMEVKTTKKFLVFRLISKGDRYVRELYHKIVHLYCAGKEKGAFFFARQAPKHLKNSFNKSRTFIKEKRGQYINNMRDSRLLKKPDGLSEFFKNMSDIDKGNGEINEPFDETRKDDKSSKGSQEKN